MTPPEMRNICWLLVVFVFNVPPTAKVIIEPRHVISNNVAF